MLPGIAWIPRDEVEKRHGRRPSMTYLRAALVVTILTTAVAAPAQSVTDRDRLGRLLRDAAPRFGFVFSADAVAAALQKAKTLCTCFDSTLNAARVGFIVYMVPRAAGEAFTAQCLTPGFSVDGSVTTTGACADFTAFSTSSAP
jgi:hypothetical protein